MEIKVRQLTTCEVASDGGAISLGFEDLAGNPAAVSVSLNQVGALIMTLPGLLEAALKARYGDQSLRYAYPLASWVLEQSTDTTQRIITLQTEDGFKVRFSIPKAEQSLLGEALTQPMPEMSVRPNQRLGPRAQTKHRLRMELPIGPVERRKCCTRRLN